MIAQELIDYIKTNLASGMDDEALKAEFRSRGFANDEIDQAFITARSREVLTNESDSNVHISRKEIFIGIAALIILASLAFLVFSPVSQKVGEVLGIFR